MKSIELKDHKDQEAKELGKLQRAQKRADKAGKEKSKGQAYEGNLGPNKAILGPMGVLGRGFNAHRIALYRRRRLAR